MTGQRERDTDDGGTDANNNTRVIEQVTIECVCGERVVGDTVGRCEANHIEHLLDTHDIPAVNRNQLRQILERKKGGTGDAV